MTLFLVFLCFTQEGMAQCYPTQVVTATFATGGSSPYIDKVLWLTWGSTDQNTDPYGKHDQNLNIGSMSYASIKLGEGLYLCVEAKITDVTGGAVKSYRPGEFTKADGTGDYLDDLYNIGGSGKANQLISGIKNKTSLVQSTITIKAKATINRFPASPTSPPDPIRISGFVIADAESLSANKKPGSEEYIYATAKGTWNVIDFGKNLLAVGPSGSNSKEYLIAKESDGSNQTIKFLQGTNQNTAAVALLSFDEAAYGTDYEVEFTAILKPEGGQALAIGLLTPNADLGDAPQSYGSPVHLIQNLNVTPDGIAVGVPATNINTAAYQSGKLEIFEGKHLGSKAPDTDNKPAYSRDAKGDDNSGNGGSNEEDAWPEQYRRFSYKVNYMVGNKITATIDYKNAEVGDEISGWIDFNLNGIFDADERITTSIFATGNGSVILEWTVPPTRVPYNTYVRLRYFDKNEDATSPTNSVNFGEVEDHRIYVLTPVITNPMLSSKSKIKK